MCVPARFGSPTRSKNLENVVIYLARYPPGPAIWRIANGYTCHPMRPRLWTRLGVVSLSASLGCTRAPPGEPDVQRQDGTASPAVPTAACEVVDARGGGTTIDTADFADPVARVVLSQACPTDFSEVAKILDERDAEACVADGFSPTRTTLLSERAQLRGTPQGSTEECTETPVAIFRGVVQRRCGGRAAHGLFASLAPIATVQSSLPDVIEMIGFDPRAEVFRFYTYEQERWRYHGDSLDMLDGMRPDGARRCAACHVGGGLVMKELDAPWMHWEGRTTTAGVQALLSQYEALGSRSHGVVSDFRPAGQELEEAIVAGNRAWMRKRIATQRQHATLSRLLRPLFCDEEINLGTAAQSPSSPTATTGESERFELAVGGLLAPRRVAGSQTLTISVADYHAALRAANQRIDTFCDKALHTDDGETVVDTVFDFAYPHRSSIDNLAVDALVEQGIVDDAFVRAVLAVDLTRPVFSEARCGLLAAVPNLNPDQRTPAAIHSAMLTALAPMQTDAAQELLTNLGPQGRDPTARVSAMVRACSERDPAELTADLHAYASQLRRKARALPVLELPEVLPVDDLPDDPGLHFDAQTCRLVRSPADDQAVAP